MSLSVLRDVLRLWESRWPDVPDSSCPMSYVVGPQSRNHRGTSGFRVGFLRHGFRSCPSTSPHRPRANHKKHKRHRNLSRPWWDPAHRGVPLVFLWPSPSHGVAVAIYVSVGGRSCPKDCCRLVSNLVRKGTMSYVLSRHSRNQTGASGSRMGFLRHGFRSCPSTSPHPQSQPQEAQKAQKPLRPWWPPCAPWCASCDFCAFCGHSPCTARPRRSTCLTGGAGDAQKIVAVLCSILSVRDYVLCPMSYVLTSNGSSRNSRNTDAATGMVPCWSPGWARPIASMKLKRIS